MVTRLTAADAGSSRSRKSGDTIFSTELKAAFLLHLMQPFKATPICYAGGELMHGILPALGRLDQGVLVAGDVPMGVASGRAGSGVLAAADDASVEGGDAAWALQLIARSPLLSVAALS